MSCTVLARLTPAHLPGGQALPGRRAILPCAPETELWAIAISFISNTSR
jgi:hypothetical protein